MYEAKREIATLLMKPHTDDAIHYLWNEHSDLFKNSA